MSTNQSAMLERSLSADTTYDGLKFKADRITLQQSPNYFSIDARQGIGQKTKTINFVVNSDLVSGRYRLGVGPKIEHGSGTAYFFSPILGGEGGQLTFYAFVGFLTITVDEQNNSLHGHFEWESAAIPEHGVPEKTYVKDGELFIPDLR